MNSSPNDQPRVETQAEQDSVVTQKDLQALLGSSVRLSQLLAHTPEAEIPSLESKKTRKQKVNDMLTSESAVRLLEHISRKFNSTSDTVQYDNTATINNKNKSVTSSKPNSFWVGPGAGEVSGIGHGVNVSAMGSQEWFIGPASREEAETLLADGDVGTLLVRMSGDTAVMSLKQPTEGRFNHIKINQTKDHAFFVSSKEKFTSVPALVNFYLDHSQEFTEKLWSKNIKLIAYRAFHC